MTTLKKCKISGLAGRPEALTISFGEVNVFFGRNGRGKTSLLRLLHAACRNDAALVATVPFDAASVTIHSEAAGRSVTRKLTCEEVGELQRDRLRRRDSAWYEVDGEIVHFGVHESRAVWNTTPKDKGSRLVCSYLPTSRVDPRANTRMESLEQLLAQQLTKTWRTYTAALNADVRSIQDAGLADMLRGVFAGSSVPPRVDDPELDMAFLRATDYLQRRGIKLPTGRASFEESYQQDAVIRGVVDRIEEIEVRLERAERPRENLRALVSDLLGEEVQIEFRHQDIRATTVSGDEIPLTRLSSGQRQLILILVETIAAGDNVIIVDEPELSMHVDWQQRLVAAMRTVNPGCQIVMATHSPEIMADLGDGDIRAL